MSVVLNGKKVEVPGLKTVSWVDPEAQSMGVKEVSHKTPRGGRWVRGIVCHTIHGVKGNLLPGLGPNTDIDTKQARYQVNTDREVSWDFTEDFNGDWLIQNDPLKNFTWQATSVNGITCGFEMVQHDNGDLYEGQIAKAVLFIDFMTAMLGIQRQIPWDKVHDKPKAGVVRRIAGDNHGKDVVGVYGHRNQTTNRGPGDPGDWLFIALKNAGYELFDFDNNDDLTLWKSRQQTSLGFAPADCDGVPGQKTIAALKERGHKHGMWLARPIDALIPDSD